MNKRQLIVQKQFIQDEKAVIRELKHEYAKALAEINERILVLQGKVQTQAVIYQLQYQLELQAQISAILDKMRTNNYQTIMEYLNECYRNGFIGSLYDLQGQGIPFLFPIDQEEVVQAVQLDSKISHGLYKSMEISVEEIKKRISSEITRGIATSLSYEVMAKNLQMVTDIDYKKSLRIVRTEGQRIQNQAELNAIKKSVEAGAKVDKQWDATLDGKTRKTHRELDGQIVGVDEYFVVPSTGKKVKAPLQFGDPAEDCNCRCHVLPRAKGWDYDKTKFFGGTDGMSQEDIERYARERGITVEELTKYKNQIIPMEAKDYNDFRRQYEKIWNHESLYVDRS